MDKQHPITPPPELVQQWRNEEPYEGLLSRAAQWGADRELEACLHWASEWCSAHKVHRLLTARRPNSPSLKQQALDLLKTDLEPGQEVASITLPAKSIDTIRRALEQLDD